MAPKKHSTKAARADSISKTIAGSMARNDDDVVVVECAMDDDGGSGNGKPTWFRRTPWEQEERRRRGGVKAITIITEQLDTATRNSVHKIIDVFDASIMVVVFGLVGCFLSSEFVRLNYVSQVIDESRWKCQQQPQTGMLLEDHSPWLSYFFSFLFFFDVKKKDFVSIWRVTSGLSTPCVAKKNCFDWRRRNASHFPLFTYHNVIGSTNKKNVEDDS